MSSGAAGADLGFDTTLGRDGISIQAIGHPLAAGLSGEVSVSDRPMAIGWATPNQHAMVVATLSATDDRPVFFGYERGQPMVDLVAPARRVGMFVHEPAAPFLAPSAWKLFDAAVDWAADARAPGVPLDPVSRPAAKPAARSDPDAATEISSSELPFTTRTALFVVGNTTLNSGDAALKSRLENTLAYTVTTLRDLDSMTAHATGKNLVLISSTVTPGNVLAKFKNVAVPVVVCENGLLDDMAMTGATSNTHFGTVGTQTQLAIVTAGSPLAAGLTGTVTVSSSSTFGWGSPVTNATIGARITGTPTNRYASFGFATGATMVSFTAPARRVGFFLAETTAAGLNTNGWRLFDAAIAWAANIANEAPAVSAGPDRSITLPATASLDGTVSDEGQPVPPGAVSVTWSKVSGPGNVTFGNAAAVDTTATLSQAGTYVLRLTATDGSLSAFDEMAVGAAPAPNQAPSVNAGADQAVSLPAAASLVGTATDDGLPNPPGSVAVTWSKVSGPGTVTFANPNAVATTATFSATATYVLRLSATDSVLAASDDLTVTASRTALFIANSSGLGTADSAVRTRMTALGFSVTAVAASTVNATHLSGKALVVASSTIPSGSFSAVGTLLRGTTVPVVTWESGIYSGLGLTGSASGIDFGSITDCTELTLLAPDHPLTGGVLGRVAVTTAASRFNWGNPGAAAVAIAADFEDTPTHKPIFGYEAGAQMVGLTAPARRVGLFLGDNPVPTLTAEGGALVDAAMLWAVGQPLPKVATPTLSLPSGTYPPGQTVALSSSTPGSTLRYSLTGDDPGAADPVVASGATVVLGNFTLKAKAWKLGSLPSDPAAASYTLSGPFTTGDVSSATFHTLAVTPDGTVWAWGAEGEALGYEGSGPVPRRAGGVTGAVAVAAGGNYSLALKADGTVWAFGENVFGQLGDGTTVSRRFAAPVSGLSGVVAIAAGVGGLAVKSNGEVWTWGNGQTTPVQVAGLSDIVAIAAGYGHTLALQDDGTLYAWGFNHSGQLGDGTTEANNVPTAVPGLSGVSGIAANGDHSLAILSNDTVWGWGDNMVGQSGQDPSQVAVVSPQQVTLPTSPRPLSIAAGYGTSYVRRDDGSVASWGTNQWGGLGRDFTGYTHVPGVVSLAVPVTKMVSGQINAFALTSDASLWAWGPNDARSLGDGTFKMRLLPVKIAEAGLDWKAATPEFSPVPSTYDTPQTVVMTSQTPGAVIHYTTEPREPNENDPAPAGGIITVDRETKVRAKAWKPGMPESNSESAEYHFQVGALSISPPSGSYTNTLTATVSCATPGVTIRYTTDGSAPTGPSSLVYTGPIAVNNSMTIRAIAVRDGWLPSVELTATYTLYLGTLNPPAITPDAGMYVGSVAVGLSSIAGATVRYTLNGGDPETWSPIYTGPLTLTANTTVKAKAYHPDYTASGVATAVYTVKLAAPGFTPPPGTYPRGQVVTLSAPPSATIHYTLDGADPTPSDPALSPGGTVTLMSPWQASTEKIVKARAFATGTEPSDVAAATYVLTVPAAAPPVFDPPAGTYTAAQAVAMTTSTADATIRYTEDGSEPNSRSRIYTEPIEVSAPTVLKARAFKMDLAASAKATGSYLIDTGTVARPAFSPLGGRYATAQTVTVSSATPGAIVRYTINGPDPTENDPVLQGGSLLVDQTLRLKARAFKEGEPPSPVRSDVYWITGAVAAGTNHSLALKMDGTVLAWGDNAEGQLGDGSLTPQPTPVPIAGLADVRAVSAGRAHTLALLANGTVMAWGDNSFGQLGNDTTADSPVPLPVTDLTNVIALSAGAWHSLAIKADGTLWAWGSASHGELGTGPGQPSHQTRPVEVSALHGVAAIAAGSDFSLAVATDGAESGSVWAFGANLWGQLGSGSGSSNVPIFALADVREVAAGEFHALALERDGTVMAWGRNNVGQLGIGTVGGTSGPVQTVNIAAAAAVSAGYDFSLAIVSDLSEVGPAWSWGNGSQGRLGNWSTAVAPSPAASLMTNAVQAAGGGGHTLALRSDTAIWASGWNVWGQLGIPSVVGSTAQPQLIPGLTLTPRDSDGDGLTGWQEFNLGSNPYDVDTNDDGLWDGAAVSAGISATNWDMDGDGLLNAAELERGTDPFVADTDGDGFPDGVDCWPLDAAQAQCPVPVPGDVTPPVITLVEPTNATLISVIPPQ